MLPLQGMNMLGKLCFTMAVLCGIVYAAFETPVLAGMALWAVYMLLSICCVGTILTSREKNRAKYGRKVIYSPSAQS